MPAFTLEACGRKPEQYWDRQGWVQNLGFNSSAWAYKNKLPVAIFSNGEIHLEYSAVAAWAQ